MSLNARIIEINEEVASFLDHEKHFTSARFLQFVSTLKKFDFFVRHLDQEEEEKENSTEYDFLWKQEVQAPLPIKII